MKHWIAALLLGTACAGATALAQGGRGGPMMRADADGDGVVTRAEYQRQADARFARQDNNGNGRIDAGEERRPPMRRREGGPPPPPLGGDDAPSAPVAAPPPPPRPQASMIGLTRDEARARAMERFDRLDKDRNGRLDAAELRAAMPPRPAAQD